MKKRENFEPKRKRKKGRRQMKEARLVDGRCWHTGVMHTSFI